jgi:hypothetical protein
MRVASFNMAIAMDGQHIFDLVKTYRGLETDRPASAFRANEFLSH